jgi:hypothetical protein
MPVHVDDSNFDREVLRSDLPVVVDVWGPDSVHFRHLEPIVKKYRKGGFTIDGGSGPAGGATQEARTAG